MNKALLTLTAVTASLALFCLFAPSTFDRAVVAETAAPIERLEGITAAINEYRASKGLNPVLLNAKLNSSAQAKSDSLVADHYWSHVAPDGTTPWQLIERAGYDYTKAGENLAKCADSAAQTVDAWIASPLHEAVLSGDYTNLGIGVALNTADGCNYTTAHFAR
jgi:uncharacterized protein YkwD